MKYVVEFELLETEKEVEEFCLRLFMNLDDYEDDDYCCALYETIEHCCLGSFVEYLHSFFDDDNELIILYNQIIKEIEPWIMSHCNDSDKVRFLTLKRVIEE